MNRIILIGNGFDLAHGLPTSYRNFIDSYWAKCAKKIYNDGIFNSYEDEFVKFDNGATCFVNTNITPNTELDSYHTIAQLLEQYRIAMLPCVKRGSCNEPYLQFKNMFFKHISQEPLINTWLDIENEYYCSLKKRSGNDSVKKLNNEFEQVKDLLEKYLTEVSQQKIAACDAIKKAIHEPLRYGEIAHTKKEVLAQDQYLSVLLSSYRPDLIIKQYAKDPTKLSNIHPKQTLFLNFNYTNTIERLYAPPTSIINIHGKLNDPNNAIIFGYGDEMDQDYEKIVNLNDNDYLKYIKSICYLKTDNYHRLLNFMNSEPYQILIMGHSCGNSDRTLLNTLFEHQNCISIKQFYYIKNDGSDNYIEIVQNIYRNFKDKALMRDVVVNKSYCHHF